VTYVAKIKKDDPKLEEKRGSPSEDIGDILDGSPLRRPKNKK
jgi:hypothetical protein